MHAEILSIGTEILMGETVDTNSSYLASQLPGLGIELRWITQVGDDPGRLREAVCRAWRRSDVTITSGGLGPTTDDLTRETISEVLGERMSVQDDLLDHLKGLFAGRGFPMPESNIKQATLIPSAQAVANPLGTAPGWWVERDGRIVAAMPGPPRELKRMWEMEVAPLLRSRNPGVAIVTRTIKTYGITEGGLNEMIAPLFGRANPSLGIYSRQDGIHLRATATAPTERAARALIKPMEDEIRGAAADAIWGEDGDTPESLAASLLSRRGATLGVIECFTGGLLASTLADAAEAAFLKGSLVAFDEGAMEGHGVEASLIERFGAASVEVAESMALAACRRFGSDVGVGVTPISTASDGSGGEAGACHVGFAVDGLCSSVTGHYPTRGLRTRGRAVTHALLELVRVLRG